jgi:hypothetical protein
MPHRRSSRTCSSRAAAAYGTPIPGLGPGPRPLSRKNAIVGPAPPVRRPSEERAESAVQSRFVPSVQRVSEWQAFPVAQGNFPWRFISSPRAYRRPPAQLSTVEFM